jgi:CRP/FNR family cyclic AMP-dependent transcriptional regulator
VARGIPTEVIRHFQAIPLFANVSKKGLRAIVQAGTEIDVPAGRTLVEEGQFGRHLYVLVSGTATVTRKGKKVADIGPGDFFGELAFLDGAPRSATVTATTGLTLIVLGPREMDVIIEREPLIAKRLLETMARRVRNSERSASH